MARVGNTVPMHRIRDVETHPVTDRPAVRARVVLVTPDNRRTIVDAPGREHARCVAGSLVLVEVAGLRYLEWIPVEDITRIRA